MADQNVLYGILFAAAAGFIIQVIRKGKHVSTTANQLTGESPVTAFKALIKNGNTNALDTGETIDSRFKTHYDQYIRPKVDAFETKRVEALGKLRKRILILIPILLLSAIWAVTHTTRVIKTTSTEKVMGYDVAVTHSTGGATDSVSAIGLLLVTGLAIWAFWPVWQYKSSIRKNIFPDVFRFYGSHWQYDPKGIGGLDASDLVAGNAIDMMRMLQRATQTQDTTTRQTRPHKEPPAFMQPYIAYGILPGFESASTKNALRGAYKSVPISLVQCTLTTSDNSD